MAPAVSSANAMIFGVGSNEKTTSDQLEKFTRDGWTKVSDIEAARPSAPPMIDRMTASSRNEKSTLPCEKPSAQRPDLALAVGHRRVHRDHLSGHGAHREEEADDAAERAEEERGALGLLLVEGGLAHRLQPQALVVLDAGAERLELARRVEPHPHARDDAQAAVRLAYELAVAPHLRLVGRSVGLEDADDLHGAVLLDVERLVEVDAADAAPDARADDGLVGTGAGRSAGDEVHLRAEPHRVVADAADGDVGHAGRAELLHRADDDGLG